MAGDNQQFCGTGAPGERRVSRRYVAVLRCGEMLQARVEVHPHPTLEPREDDEWWWDIAGMAIMKQGAPWTSASGVRDFHDVPGDATWDWGEGGTVVVTIPSAPGSPAKDPVTVQLSPSDLSYPLGTDGVG